MDHAIETGEFTQNAALVGACDARVAVGRQATRHRPVVAGRRAHERHIHAFVRMAAARNVPSIAVHAILDGRDMPPKSAAHRSKRCRPCRNRRPYRDRQRSLLRHGP